MRRERFLIVGTSRCGKSFLSTLLTGAGADFGMPRQDSRPWPAASYEHPLLIRAHKWHARSEKISHSLLPSCLRDLYQRRARKDLARLLENAAYINSPILVRLYHYLAGIDHDYRIILAYRRFGSYVVSRHVKNGWPVNRLVAEYLGVNQTGFLELNRHGGCAVSYEEMTSSEETAWAAALARVTGLAGGRLLALRDGMLSLVRNEPSVEILDPRPDEVYERLRSMSGMALEPAAATPARRIDIQTGAKKGSNAE